MSLLYVYVLSKLTFELNFFVQQATIRTIAECEQHKTMFFNKIKIFKPYHQRQQYRSPRITKDKNRILCHRLTQSNIDNILIN